MSRRNRAPEREVIPDPLLESKLVAKFINVVMIDGKKSIAERIVYDAFNIIAETEARSLDNETGKKYILDYFKKALSNASPDVEVKSRRVGGANYQVPVEVKTTRRDALGMRAIVAAAQKRNDSKTMNGKLANEIRDAAQNKGGAVKKREDTHKMAEANKAFSHYRW